jgi:hypothetical protein
LSFLSPYLVQIADQILVRLNALEPFQIALEPVDALEPFDVLEPFSSSAHYDVF